VQGKLTKRGKNNSKPFSDLTKQNNPNIAAYNGDKRCFERYPSPIYCLPKNKSKHTFAKLARKKERK
jgi:hypothetical protein